MMVPLKTQDLLEFLRSQKYDAQVQGITHQIYVIFKNHNLEFPLFIKTDGLILQLIIFLPCTFTLKDAGEVARYLHFLNKEIDLPGFGMDETPGVIFYRTVFPTTNGEIESELLRVIILSMPKVAQAFYPPINSASQGTPFVSLIDQTRKIMNTFRQT